MPPPNLEPNLSSLPDLDEAPLDRFEHAGQKGIDDLLEGIATAADRRRSKSFVKNLTHAFQNPQTEYRHRRWRNLFNTWREKLGTHSSKIPDCEELIRFWENVLTRTKPRSDNALSHRWLLDAITRTVLHCVFQYEDFVLSRRSRLRIKAIVETFLKQGLLTKDKSRIRR